MGAITQEEMQEANRLAQTVPRNRSAAGRLAIAAKNYDAAIARLGPGPHGRLRTRGIALPFEHGSTRVLPDGGFRVAPARSPEDEVVAAGCTDLDEALRAYGYGRALERAIQEARFGE